MNNYTILDCIKMFGKIETNGRLSDTINYEEFMNMLSTVEVKDYTEKTSGYTDIGHIILGKVIEEITNKDINEYYKESIFNKYNMPNTMFNPSKEYKLLGNGNSLYLPHDFKTRTAKGMTGAAGLFGNIKDLTTFSKELYNYNIFDKEFINEIYNYNFVDVRNRNRSYSGLYKYTNEYNCYVPKEFSKYSLAHQGFTGALIVSDLHNKFTQVMLFNALKDGAKVKHPDFLKGFYEFQKRINEYSILLYLISTK